MRTASGVTRFVVIGKRWVVKLPHKQMPLRGWLANRSEWKQRERPDVNPPTLTLFYFASLYRAADELSQVEREGESNEESKASSWGRFGDAWKLIDFDRAWQPPRGLVGAIYYGKQERLARKWANLPCACGCQDS